ncbi:Hypothetical predicted protein [Podarcis lilfordi]|uniref:Uncharacterized protein n=1 Tax=Podarcis lilfordi TaxID=74358 RepID=A0AA35K7T3_9SAUR|nr:Hypothetical predicted protein [Podarcis lilfordi]
MPPPPSGLPESSARLTKRPGLLESATTTTACLRSQYYGREHATSHTLRRFCGTALHPGGPLHAGRKERRAQEAPPSFLSASDAILQ